MEKGVGPSTQNQAASALLFLYREVLGTGMEGRSGVFRAKRPSHMPAVLDRPEVVAVLAALPGRYWTIASLLYGSGLRLQEALELRMKDVSLEREVLEVRSGKGMRDRITPLASVSRTALTTHMERVRARHEDDLRAGAGWVPLPKAFDRKSPRSGRELAWQWMFPGRSILEVRPGRKGRVPLHPSAVQRAIRQAARRAGIHKRVHPHALRHSFATHLLEDGCDIRRLQKLMGHRDVRTTMVYLHVIDQAGPGVRSPLDRIQPANGQR